ncbi:MAG: hypothetical protein EXR29_15145 [Betaproteobacteria bacterium]|nr:hypothetical protein [Betaproteobacteria bacterium]
MAGTNIVQKILARAAGKETRKTGEFVHVRSNCITPIDPDRRPTTSLSLRLSGDSNSKGIILNKRLNPFAD